MRAVVYTRISKDATGEGLGVERQRKDCCALVEREGWTLVDVLTDNDISAYSGKRRPDYERLMTLIESRQVDVVVAYSPERLHRRPVELERYIDACEASNVATRTIAMGNWDLSTPGGKLVARQLGSVARYRVDEDREKIRRALDQRAADGKPSGGRRAFGYRRDGSLVPEEAAAIRAGYEEIANGGTLEYVARMWREAGLTTTARNQWTGPLVRLVLQRERNIGVRTRQRGPSVRGQWEPLVSTGLWQTVNDILSDPNRRTNAGAQPRHLGSRFYLCGTCDRVLRTTGHQRGTQYRCTITPDLRKHEPPRTPHVTVPAVELDDHVTWRVLGGIAEQGVDFLRETPPPTDFTSEDLDKRESTLTTRYVTGKLSEQAFNDGMSLIESQREELRQVEASFYHPTDLEALSQSPREAWDAMSLGRRRALLRDIATVRVFPTGRARAPLSERVEVRLNLDEWTR